MKVLWRTLLIGNFGWRASHWPARSFLNMALQSGTLLLQPTSLPSLLQRGQTSITVWRLSLPPLAPCPFLLTAISPSKSFPHLIPSWSLLLGRPKLTHYRKCPVWYSITLLSGYIQDFFLYLHNSEVIARICLRANLFHRFFKIQNIVILLRFVISFFTLRKFYRLMFLTLVSFVSIFFFLHQKHP